MGKHFIFYILSSAFASAVMAVFGQGVHNGGTMPGVGTMFSWVEHTIDLPDPATTPIAAVIYDLERDVNCQNKAGFGWVTAYDKFPAFTGSYADPAWITSLAFTKIAGFSSSNVTAALGYTPYNSTNPNSYISSFTETDPFWHADSSGYYKKTVITSLLSGKYDASNPNSYISSISSGNVTTALGFTPYNSTNPAGYTSSTGTATSIGISSSDFSISGSPITTSGSITANLNTTGVSAGTYGIVTVTAKGLVTAGKRQELYSGTTNASGVYTVTFGTSFSAAPNIQACVTNQSVTNQGLRVTSISTTGFTINVFQRNSVNLLATDLLLSSTVNVNGATVDVIVTEK